MSEIRYDPLKNSYSVVANERRRRVEDFTIKNNNDIHDYASFCPFCGDDATKLYEIYRMNEEGSSNWATKVVPNKYPLFGIKGNVTRTGEGYYDCINGIGAHEIIIDSNRHGDLLTAYTHKEIANLFIAYKYRILDLMNDTRLKYFVGIKNIGRGAGALINHPHSQLIAMPLIPRKIKDILVIASEHYGKKCRCLTCDILEQEYKSGARVVSENHDFIALVPYSSSAFEVTIYPKYHSASYEHISDNVIPQLAELVRDIFIRYDILLDTPAVSMALRTAPPTANRESDNNPFKNVDKAYHWSVELKPVITCYSAFEQITGIDVNPVTPEESCRYLKEVIIV